RKGNDLTQKLIILDREKDLRYQLIIKGKERAKDFSAEKFIQAFHRLILGEVRRHGSFGNIE
ncbi:hypothetical protein, partial [Algoriphagus sp. AK58]|uniref:hypothetical protein n=1 Tax=Algoriphagus sp. AK58 TaxID=1406877 RepID=UPI001C9BF825